jgi:NADP-dependent 3-hydroxy acid dehydrogenase YdfG
LVEPGAVKTELATHVRGEVWEQLGNVFTNTELMDAEDIAETITFIVTRPRRVAINEVLIRPTEQER